MIHTPKTDALRNRHAEEPLSDVVIFETLENWEREINTLKMQLQIARALARHNESMIGNSDKLTKR